MWNVLLKPGIFMGLAVKASMETIWQIDGGKRKHSARSGSEAGINEEIKVYVIYVYMNVANV